MGNPDHPKIEALHHATRCCGGPYFAHQFILADIETDLYEKESINHGSYRSGRLLPG